MEFAPLGQRRSFSFPLCRTVHLWVCRALALLLEQRTCAEMRARRYTPLPYPYMLALAGGEDAQAMLSSVIFVSVHTVAPYGFTHAPAAFAQLSRRFRAPLARATWAWPSCWERTLEHNCSERFDKWNHCGEMHSG